MSASDMKKIPDTANRHMIELRLFGFAALYSKSWYPRGSFELYPDTQNAHLQRAQQAQHLFALLAQRRCCCVVGNPEAIHFDGLSALLTCAAGAQKDCYRFRSNTEATTLPATSGSRVLALNHQLIQFRPTACYSV
jgi:hypothetical protein